MKNMKKFSAIVLAIVMVLMYAVPVSFAGEGGTSGSDTGGSGSEATEPGGDSGGGTTGGDTGSTTPAPGALTADGTVTVKGVDSGDVVSIYKIIGWSDGNWVLDHTIEGITVGDLTENADNTDHITAKEAAKVAANPGNAKETKISEGSDLTFTVDPGMYLVLVVDKNNDTVYNPAFVSSDYKTNNGSNVVDLSKASLPAGSSTILKKEDLTLDKKIDNTVTTNGDTDKQSVAVGDVVPFEVSTVIPTYAENYTDPMFQITDKLSTGITMTQTQQDAISVSVTGYPGIVKKANDAQTTWDYEVKPTASGYVVNFSKAFLQSVHGNPQVTIKYAATVGEDAASHNVDRFTNDVTLEFSNDPTNSSNHGTRNDETNHYTFGIDATLNGENSGREVTKEVVKIGVDEAGQAINSWTTSDETSWNNKNLLAGAEFTLTGGPNNVNLKTTSGTNGEISFTGLDAGTYTLTETKAPEGYVKDPNSKTVVIAATYKAKEEGSDIQVLDYYTVTIDGKDVSKYTITNDSENDGVITTIVKDNTNVTSPFVNTRGAELPSTGGIGTTIFYILGTLLVLGAGVLLVTRRRMQSEK